MKEFLEKIESLDNVTQWAERDSVIKESVSQHSFKVAAICAYLLQSVENTVVVDWPNDNLAHWQRFKADCLSYAILHDFDEAIIGRDISHVIKYNKFNGEEFRKVIDEFVNHEIAKEFSTHISIFVSRPSVKIFVKLCDWIALYTFVKRNVRMGVKTFDHENDYCGTRLAEAIDNTVSDFEKTFGILLSKNWWIKTINI